mmetsp:Transcript_10188/g.8993  ORF Transcript_10188/g.8993 Transcript_10188/m.8993 type:complete len:127 (-) Transcript_10188:1111-1491(-)
MVNKPNTLNSINCRIKSQRESFVSNADSEASSSKYDNIDNIQKRLYDEVLLSMQDSADMDIQEQVIKEKLQKETENLQEELLKAEEELVESMKNYVSAEDAVCDLENHDRDVHTQVHSLMNEYEEL